MAETKGQRKPRDLKSPWWKPAVAVVDSQGSAEIMAFGINEACTFPDGGECVLLPREYFGPERSVCYQYVRAVSD